MSGSEKMSYEVAVVGMAGRFPKAATLDEFWRNLRDGVEGVSFFSDAELEAAAGGKGSQSTGKVSFSSFSITKKMDKASPIFFQN